MKIISLAFSLIITSCMTKPLATTCERFNMKTEYVKVKAVNSEVISENKIITEFKCIPITTRR